MAAPGNVAVPVIVAALVIWNDIVGVTDAVDDLGRTSVASSDESFELVDMDFRTITSPGNSSILGMS